MNPTYPLLILPFFLFFAISNGPSVPMFALARELAENTQMSPSPGPSAVDGGVRCEASSSNSCSVPHKMTACLLSSTTAPKKLYILVRNNGEATFKVSITISNITSTFPETIPPNRTVKINIPVNIEGSPSIILHAGNKSCTIHIDSSEKKGKANWPFSAYAANLTPVHGAYFFIVSTLTIIGVCICFKMGKSQKQVNGVRYQELEMAQPESVSVTEVEIAEGWNQDWDDEWQELTNDKAPIPRQGNTSTSELASRNTSPYGSAKDRKD